MLIVSSYRRTIHNCQRIPLDGLERPPNIDDHPPPGEVTSLVLLGRIELSNCVRGRYVVVNMGIHCRSAGIRLATLRSTTDLLTKNLHILGPGFLFDEFRNLGKIHRANLLNIKKVLDRTINPSEGKRISLKSRIDVSSVVNPYFMGDQPDARICLNSIIHDSKLLSRITKVHDHIYMVNISSSLISHF
ncbi:hypothetical protein D9M69_490400 [compost metagenome]